MPCNTSVESEVEADLERLNRFRRLLEGSNQVHTPPPPAYSLEAPTKPSKLKEIGQIFMEFGRFLVEIVILVMVITSMIANTIGGFLDEKIARQPMEHRCCNRSQGPRRNQRPPSRRS